MRGPNFAIVLAALAGGPATPGGDPDVVLELQLPLTPEGQIDAARYAAVADYCRARRLTGGKQDWSCRLVRLDDGWALRNAATEDEPLWRLDVRLLRPGEHLTLHRPDGAAFIFRVVNLALPAGD